jgi:hypothetical protein
MVNALNLKPGDNLLDCTLGLASDAIVASYVAGSGGKITGLEASPVIGEIVSYGLKHYITGDKDIDESMRRIEVLNIRHQDYLSGMAADSYDAVYFDPMFRSPRYSASMNILRQIALPDPIEPSSLNEALRVAQKRVVLKETKGSPEFKRFGISSIIGGQNSEVAFGVLDKWT